MTHVLVRNEPGWLDIEAGRETRRKRGVITIGQIRAGTVGSRENVIFETVENQRCRISRTAVRNAKVKHGILIGGFKLIIAVL